MQKIIVYWRDIPSQVIVKAGRRRGRVALSERFQESIDRAAMRAGKGGSDEYMADWRRESSSYPGDGEPQALAEQEAARIEAGYSDEGLAALVAAFGLGGNE